MFLHCLRAVELIPSLPVHQRSAPHWPQLLFMPMNVLGHSVNRLLLLSELGSKGGHLVLKCHTAPLTGRCETGRMMATTFWRLNQQFVPSTGTAANLTAMRSPCAEPPEKGRSYVGRA